MKPKRSKKLDMKWHWLIYKDLLEQLRVYWDKESKNGTEYFTKHRPPIHHPQMLPRYIHTLNLARTITQTIRVCEGVLNQVPDTQSHIKSLKVIQAEIQSMTMKFYTVRRLNHPRQHIM